MSEFLYSRPPERAVHAPAGGWVERSLYLVEVAYSRSNIVHMAYLYTGFLSGPNNEPRAYAQLWSGGYDKPQAYTDVYWLRVVRLLHTTGS